MGCAECITTIRTKDGVCSFLTHLSTIVVVQSTQPSQAKNTISERISQHYMFQDGTVVPSIDIDSPSDIETITDGRIYNFHFAIQFCTPRFRQLIHSFGRVFFSNYITKIGSLLILRPKKRL